MTEKEPKGNFWEDGHILGHKGAVIPGLFIAQNAGLGFFTSVSTLMVAIITEMGREFGRGSDDTRTAECW